MTNIIFYFSSTGNSLAVARLVAKKLGDTEVVSIMVLRENSAISDKYDKDVFSTRRLNWRICSNDL